MNTPKWIPKHSPEVLRLFEEARQLEHDLRLLGMKFATNVNLNLPDYYEFGQLIRQCSVRFEHSERLQSSLASLSAMSTNKRIERSPYKVLQSKRATLCRLNLRRRHSQLIFVVQKMIRTMLSGGLYSDAIIDGALLLCNLHNESVALTQKNSKPVSGAQVCSNSFPALLLPAKKFDMAMILQTISKQRSEMCCLSLISCLLASCTPDLGANRDDSSDTSSVEILKALTVHMASPVNVVQDRHTNNANQHSSSIGLVGDDTIVLTENTDNDPTVDFFDKLVLESTVVPTTTQCARPSGSELLDQLIANEENYIANVLLKCLKLCPNSFDTQPNKAEIIKWVNRGTRSLWTQVGSTLEHVVLWWNSSPLACRPTACAKHLRDWLLIMQPEDAPEPILSTLRGLGETMTVFVAGTTWDHQFRLALVSSSMAANRNVEHTNELFYCSLDSQPDGTATGRLWSELLHSLTTFSNNCDRNGTIPNELPIVEQIPVLHRLDHSIHTMRLWAAAQAKAMCTDWNMRAFFKVVHHDVTHCLEQLQELRVPEMVPSDSTEVLVQVCVALRAKLVSEIKVNINKLKETYGQCIDVMAKICRTISLATLSLCFPDAYEWQTNDLHETTSEYVLYYLDQLYLPVFEATTMLDILSLVLKILCEAWLDHIYGKKIRFSRVGAINLMKDFDGVAAWIAACPHVQSEHVQVLSGHEVLRMCEGVAKILLRKPDEVISMVTRAVRGPKSSSEATSADDQSGQLPPEMFVPNQQRWLELRARNRSAALNCLCACITASSKDGAASS